MSESTRSVELTLEESGTLVHCVVVLAVQERSCVPTGLLFDTAEMHAHRTEMLGRLYKKLADANDALMRGEAK